ncbi:MAG TPA: phosphoglycerate dehydrogenase [Myxococcaceae bacterium]|nr:phosphoglycerate dehydrogenase [Myxococcaceae bacterium]
MRVLVSDDLSAEGVEILRQGKGITVDVKVGLKAPELKAIIGEYDGLAVRSATKVTAEILEAGKNLKVVGRAGVGVDNVDLEAANRRGVVVMNTPGGNTITVAELTVAMMLSVSRHIAQATASIKSGKWEKKKFQGRELFNKTLGVIGIGNIGSAVVERCLGMKMKVVAYDPFISAEAAKAMGCELLSLEDVYRRSDYLSVHVPLTEQTRNLINKDAFAKMKKGAFLVNCARGGIVDEAALHDALASGHLGGAAFDVFASEPVSPDHPLLKLDNFICTPHLGASTEEAQSNVALALAEQMVDFFSNGVIRNAINVPSVPREVLDQLGPWLNLAQKLGALVGQLSPEGVTEVEVGVSGELTQQPSKPIVVQALKGLLGQVWGESVNEVNAPVLAKERGIAVVEQRRGSLENFASSVTLKVKGKTEVMVEGTLFGRHDPRIVRVNQFEIEAVPVGHLIAVHNRDVPGIVGKVGSLLGEAGVNIGRIHLSRHGNEAFSLINVDSEPGAKVLESLRGIEGVKTVRHIRL